MTFDLIETAPRTHRAARHRFFEARGGGGGGVSATVHMFAFMNWLRPPLLDERPVGTTAEDHLRWAKVHVQRLEIDLAEFLPFQSALYVRKAKLLPGEEPVFANVRMQAYARFSPFRLREGDNLGLRKGDLEAAMLDFGDLIRSHRWNMTYRLVPYFQLGTTVPSWLQAQMDWLRIVPHFGLDSPFKLAP